MTAAPSRPRTGSLGCLGCFSILCLMLFSAVLIGLSWWLNASWFDRVAFWRAPRVEAEPVALEGKEAEAARAAWSTEFPEPAKRPPPSGPVLIEASKTSGDYQPASGGTVTDAGNGASVRLPAGALGRPANVTLTQALRVPPAMAASFAGPVYEVKVDGREHTEFQRPIELSFPYVQGLVPNDQVGVTVWENGRWTPLPSRVDPARGVVTATSAHASLFSVSNLAHLFRLTPGAGWGLTILGGILAGAESPTLRAAAFVAFYGRSRGYETPEGNFKLHYYTYGSAKIPRDWEVVGDPFTPKDTDPDRAPLYVRRLGHWLEHCRKELHAEGFDLPPARLIRYDCFVVPDGETGGNLGASSLGGPLFISPRIHEIAGAATGGPFDPESVMKATCAHELIHVWQGRFYSNLKAELLPWAKIERLCEADAEYNSWRFWRKRDMEDKYHEQLVVKEPGLPGLAFNLTGETERYAYSLLFEWIQHRHGEALAREVLVAAHGGGDGSLSSLNAAVQKTLGPRGLGSLGEAMAEFGADYYHRDHWNRSLVPLAYKDATVAKVAYAYFFSRFFGKSDVYRQFLSAARESKDGLVRNAYASLSRGGMAPATSIAAYVLSDPIVRDMKKPQPSLVIEVEGPAASSPGLHVAVGRGELKDPFSSVAAPDGGLGAVESLPLSGGRGQILLKNFAAKNGPNAATVIVTNRWIEGDLGGLTIHRWLLEPPPYAQLELQTQGQDKWILKWKPAPLARHREVFKTYRIYRRPLHASEEVKELVKDVPSFNAEAETEQTELEGRDVADHQYAVAVVDVRGNESDPRDADLKDPFVGVWEGSFKLVDGSFVKPVMELIRRKGVEYDTKRAAEIQRIEDPGQRQAAIQRLEENKKARAELAKLLEDFLGGAEEATRMGVPIEFQIRLDGGKYLFSVREVVWGLVPLEKEARVETELKRAGKLTLRVPDMPEELPPMNFTLRRMDPEGKKPNIIREENYVLQTTGEASKELPIRCVLRWDFERKSAENPPKP